LIAALEVLGMHQVNEFIQGVVLWYIPHVFVAAIMLAIAAVAGDAVKSIVMRSASAAGVTSANFLGATAKYAVWIFALFAALHELNIAPGISSDSFRWNYYCTFARVWTCLWDRWPTCSSRIVIKNEA
jgi:hypothetical protein